MAACDQYWLELQIKKSDSNMGCRKKRNKLSKKKKKNPPNFNKGV